jgi:hypothetical protein
MVASLASLVMLIEGLNPTDGGYRMDPYDKWRVDVDGSSQETLRPFLARIVPGSGSYDGAFSEDIDVEWPIPKWSGARTFDGLDSVYAYDIARRSAAHLIEVVTRSLPYSGVAHTASWTLTESADPDSAYLIVSVSLTLHYPRS